VCGNGHFWSKVGEFIILKNKIGDLINKLGDFINKLAKFISF
jgi:hypothetical protein